jgi:hypothetical protein
MFENLKGTIPLHLLLVCTLDCTLCHVHGCSFSSKSFGKMVCQTLKFFSVSAMVLPQMETMASCRQTLLACGMVGLLLHLGGIDGNIYKVILITF